jgi:hypothetical protein
MLPLVVLRRLDCVLEPTKDAVLAQHKKLQAQNLPQEAMDRTLSRAADPKRKQPLYNISPFTFERLLGDSENINGLGSVMLLPLLRDRFTTLIRFLRMGHVSVVSDAPFLQPTASIIPTSLWLTDECYLV